MVIKMDRQLENHSVASVLEFWSDVGDYVEVLNHVQFWRRMSVEQLTPDLQFHAGVRHRVALVWRHQVSTQVDHVLIGRSTVSDVVNVHEANHVHRGFLVEVKKMSLAISFLFVGWIRVEQDWDHQVQLLKRSCTEVMRMWISDIAVHVLLLIRWRLAKKGNN